MAAIREPLYEVVTFSSDFGLADSYVAEMKGAFLAACAEERVHAPVIVDGSHEIARHDLAAASRLVRSLADSFPPRTLHVVVVDPGVGTDRRGIAVAVRGAGSAGGDADAAFIGPDNGILSTQFGEASSIVGIDPGLRRIRAHGSRVFDGRDLFAPAAARAVAEGILSLGTVLRDPVRLSVPMARVSGSVIEGEVLAVDAFGNARTNIGASFDPGRAVVVEVAGRTVPLVGAYGDVARGALLALASSDGSLEIAVREGSAAELLGVTRGSRVRVTLGAEWPADAGQVRERTE